MLRNEIVAQARTWIGTRFHHQGRLKQTLHHKGGVDCLGLLIGVASELNLKSKNSILLKEWDEVNYTHFPNTYFLRSRLEECLYPIALSEIQSGDIGLFSMQDSPQHLGIIDFSGNALIPYTLIHAYAQARKVVEHSLDDNWNAKLIAAYSCLPPE